MYYIPRIVALLTLLGAVVWSVQLARADSAFREGTPEGVVRAIELAPGNTAYIALGALQREYDGRDAAPLLERMVQLSPVASAPRIRLGLAAEQRGDVQGAEQLLLGAFAVDHQFEPRWTLANFYFRQGKTDEFWKWIRSALDVSYGDRRPAFDLCWRMSAEAEEILDKAIPEREEVTSDYLMFLMNRPVALASAAKKVHRTEFLLAANDVLLDAALYGDAVEVWRQTGRAVPQGVTAPNFEPPQTGRGFDWRWSKEIGVRHRSPAHIELTGEQPESIELLRQYVGGLRPGERYQLHWTSSAAVPGVGWRVNGVPATDFSATAEVVLLSLWYQRPLGEVRAEVAFDLSEVKLLPLH